MWNFEIGSSWYMATVHVLCFRYNSIFCTDSSGTICPVKKNIFNTTMSCNDYCRRYPEITAGIISDHAQQSVAE